MSSVTLSLLVLASTLAFCLAGDGDTFDQLRVAYGNFPMEHSVHKAPVTIESGEIPEWLSGSFMRHACGAFGESFTPANYINYIDHLFDCIETGQSYHFDNGEVTFTNKYYDTNTNDIYLSYDQNMNESSLFYGTAFATFNLSQVVKHAEDMNRPGKVRGVPHVSWWQLGDSAIAMTEYPSGVLVDVDDVESLGYFPYEDDNMGYPEEAVFEKSPAHEHTDSDGRIWSTVAMYQPDDEDPNILKTWRAVYTLDPETNERVVVGEYHHPDVDLTLCEGSDAPYPDPEGRLRYMHAFQMTENYIALLETSYMFNPCAIVYGDSGESNFLRHYTYEPEVNGIIRIMRKTDGDFLASIETPPYFATHMLGAYEAGDLMHLDFLYYEDSSPYDFIAFYKNIFEGGTYETWVKRFTANMISWTLDDFRDIMNDMPQPLEMSNINYNYQGREYQYAYMVRNIFALHAVLIKLNVDDGTYLEYEMPDGLFPQEPWFVEDPDAIEEDDGVIMVQGIDGVQERGFLMIFDAKDFSLISHVTGSDLTLAGLHNKFFPLDNAKTARGGTSGFSSSTSHVTATAWLVVLLMIGTLIH